MSLIDKTLWYVESHLDRDIQLSDIARAVGVGRFHITRLFGLVTGLPLMTYVRARRLSEAARHVITSNDILSVAIGAGYGSHEAFSRAFRAQFGLSPKALRQTGSLAHLTLMEPIDVTQAHPLPAQTPKRLKAPAIVFAGLTGHYTTDSTGGIAGQWQKFREHLGQIEGQKGEIYYGISWNFAGMGEFDYMAAAEVDGDNDLPEGFTRLKTAAHDYAVFTHDGHVSGISNFWRHIYESWLPEAGLRPINAPNFERMDDRFNYRTGTGVVEVWIPVG